jgi:cytoskeleton protein RodZ
MPPAARVSRHDHHRVNASRIGAAVLHEGRARLAKERAKMSTAARVDAEAPVAPRVGADLCAARERLGWNLPAVAAGLRIRLNYLEALEEGRISDLPGNAYALGFLRTYAGALGLDPDELTRRFRNEAAEVNRKTQLEFPVPVPERGVPAGAVVLLGVVLAVGAYVGWYRLSGEGRLPAEAPAPVPARLAPLAEQAVPPAPTPVPAPVAVAADVPPVTPPLDVPAVPPSQAAAAMPPPPPAAPVAPAADQTRIMVRATADAWLLVRDKSGQVLLNRVLHAGDTWPVPVKPNLLLTTGNAGGTEFVVDGVTAPSVGGSGVVRRDLPLDPDLIRDGKVLAQAALPPAAVPATPPQPTSQSSPRPAAQ